MPNILDHLISRLCHPSSVVTGMHGFEKKNWAILKLLETTVISAQLYQIHTDKFIHISLNHHFINTTRNSNVFRHLKGHLQGVWLVHSSIMVQQNESPAVKLWKSSEIYSQIQLSCIVTPEFYSWWLILLNDAASIYQPSLKMKLQGLKHVGVTYCVNRLVT